MEREEAIARIKARFDTWALDEEDMKAIQTFIPELAESEDEKIGKFLINILSSGTWKKEWPFGPNECVAWLEKQKQPTDKGEISDGYHTFNELYYYRMLYNAAFFNLLPKEWVHKSKKHHDGEECFGGGWFIVMAQLPTGQISNHYELKDWDLFHIPEKEVADEWDGHSPQEAVDRLHKYLWEEQKEQKPAEWSEDYREEDIQTRFAFYTYKDDSSVLYLSNVFVEESSRNHGFGTRILKAAEKVAETIGAITISLKVKQDSPANAWYRKNGYGYVTFEDGYDWLEKNLEYLKPKKSAEWSEEDKKRIQRIYNFMWKNRKGDTDTIYQIEKDADWLKSLLLLRIDKEVVL